MLSRDYRLGSNFLFLGRVIEQVVVNEMNYLDPFQFGFWLGFETETALVSLVDYTGVLIGGKAFLLGLS